MKATLTTLLALAMLSGAAFADTPTYVSSSPGEIVVDPDNPENPNYFYGIYTEEGSAVGADVAIHEENYGTDCLHRNVYGGYSYGYEDEDVANGNKVTMTSGCVTSITVGETWGGAANYNTFVMKGGTVLGDVQVSAPCTDSIGNVAILTAGHIEVSLTVGAAYGEDNVAASNKLHLVGVGATAMIKDGQGNVDTYTGSEEGISLGEVIVAGSDEESVAENNSIDVYGSGIEATSLDGFDQLNFHMVDGLTTTGTPMVSLTGHLDLGNLLASPIGLYGDAVTNWEAFEGKEITLISDAGGINVLRISGDGIATTLDENYNILDAYGNTVATATLSLVSGTGSAKSLVMSNIQGNVPEPTTGTLGLLALCALCARRRRK